MTNNTSLQLGLEVLNKLDKPKTRRKIPYAHIYKQPNKSYRFKAIVHEEIAEVPSTRQSFKALIHIVPIEREKVEQHALLSINILFYAAWLLGAVAMIHYIDHDVRWLLCGLHIILGSTFWIIYKKLKQYME